MGEITSKVRMPQMNDHGMYKNDTRDQQLRVGTLFVPFAAIYNKVEICSHTKFYKI